jgi:hypothetical protein
MADKQVTIVVNLVQGAPLRFKGKRSDQDLLNLASRIERAMEARYLGVELDGKLTLIPATNIGSIEISPVPSEPMKGVIRDVQAMA